MRANPSFRRMAATRACSLTRKLVVFQGTVRFCARFLERRDRTVDQMIQAARSGKQNIIEGSKASGTSKETEIKLIGVARASLENCWRIIAIFCACGKHHFGLKIAEKRSSCANSERGKFSLRLPGRS